MYAVENDYWRDFAIDARRLGSPLYERLSLAVDADPQLKALAARARTGQPQANLLFAAVHFLLLKGAQHPLRQLYATLGGAADAGDAFPLFRDFVLGHEAEISALIESRVTNTNETARSCVLRAGFAALAQREKLPIHTIEVGPSAGLNLIWDRYGTRYRRGDQIVAAFNPDSPVQLDCELRGPKSPPLSPLPQIASRIGLELHPVDLGDELDRDWLRALVWPDQPQRLERLDRAIALFRQTPPQIRGGDALTLLPDAMAQVPAGEALCVYHTIAVYQFSEEMRQVLRSLLVTAGLRRPVWHLAFEFDGGQDYDLTLTHHHGGVADTQKLALGQPHGGWIEWLD